MPRAYVLIETTSDKITKVRDALGRLSNSKALVESLFPNELVAHIEGSNPESLQDALTNQVPGIDGVKRLTIWLVTNR